MSLPRAPQTKDRPRHRSAVRWGMALSPFQVRSTNASRCTVPFTCKLSTPTVPGRFGMSHSRAAESPRLCSATGRQSGTSHSLSGTDRTGAGEDRHGVLDGRPRLRTASGRCSSRGSGWPATVRHTGGAQGDPMHNIRRVDHEASSTQYSQAARSRDGLSFS